MGRHIITQEDIKPKETRQPITKKTQQEIEEEGYVYHDHPNTMENSTATFIYIIIMVIGSIFKDAILIWITASLIYFNFIFRHEKRKQEWDKIHKPHSDEEIGGDKK